MGNNPIYFDDHEQRSAEGKPAWYPAWQRAIREAQSQRDQEVSEQNAHELEWRAKLQVVLGGQLKLALSLVGIEIEGTPTANEWQDHSLRFSLLYAEATGSGLQKTENGLYAFSLIVCYVLPEDVRREIESWDFDHYRQIIYTLKCTWLTDYTKSKIALADGIDAITESAQQVLKLYGEYLARSQAGDAGKASPAAPESESDRLARALARWIRFVYSERLYEEDEGYQEDEGYEPTN